MRIPFLAFVSLLAWSCSERPPAPAGAEGPARVDDATPPSQPHEHRAEAAAIASSTPPTVENGAERLPALGRWRLVDPAEIDRVVLWLSHVLIRYEGVNNPDDVAFDHAGWRYALPPSTRSRTEALELAAEIVERARQEPERFATLARELSEDPTTAFAGGSLGGLPAVTFMAWPQLLDQFALMRAGDVSGVVESGHGFHVFFRHPPPVEQRVSGQHIVIGYDEAPWLGTVARREVPKRSRAEALALATRIAERARRVPADFGALVAEYSEHQDAAVNGDFGEWSTHEVSAFPREIAALARLDEGAISDPIDTRFGYQVFKRTPLRPRARWAMQRVELHFDPTLPDAAPNSRASVLSLARSLADTVAASPERFDELQARYCCRYALPVVEGRYPPAVERALARLEPGGIAREPVPHGASTFLLVKRVDERDLLRPRAPLLDLPDPKGPDVEYLMRSRSAELIEGVIHALGRAARASLSLSPAQAERLIELHAAHGRFAEVSASERLAFYRALHDSVRELLGPTLYLRYAELAERQLEQLSFTTGIWSTAGP